MMTLRRRGRRGGGRRPTVDERGAYNGQAAGSTARLTGVRYPCSARRQVSFASVHQRRRRGARLDTPLQANVLKDARDDVRLGNSANDLAGAAAPRAPAPVDGKYPVQSGHPAQRRGAHAGLGLGELGARTRFGGAGGAWSVGDGGRRDPAPAPAPRGAGRTLSGSCKAMSVSALDCSPSVTTSCPAPTAPGSACHYKSMQPYRLAAGG